MKKALLACLVLALLFVGSGKVTSQTSEFQTKILAGTADAIIDSTLDSLSMSGRRVYINTIYVWWDNGANTNPMNIQVVRGRSALATATAARSFQYTEAMTSGGIKALTFLINCTTGRDSTIYFVVQGTGTDSIFAAFNYKMVN